ncbi:hypothetical protein FRC09_011580 [Ceratobasidium sp. 395]|nr:hypothetical protein FRC09_011580 [Ceratobasidium sp. 395]
MAPSRTEKGSKAQKASVAGSTKAKIAKSSAKSKSVSEDKCTTKFLAKAANKKSSHELQILLDGFLCTPPTNKDGESTLAWTVYDGPELKNSPQKDNVWALFETNMRDIYIEAKDPYLKWNPTKKKRELFDKKSRYIILEAEDQSDLAAFCMFRFETEENTEGTMEFVVYIYEIQVSKEFQGLGICRRIFDALERLGSEYQAQLIMLTVFRCNPDAITIYKHLKFEEHDDTSDTAFVFFKAIL